MRFVFRFAILVAFAMSLASAQEPTSIAQVKTIIMRFEAAPNTSTMVLTELEARLPEIGIAVTADQAEADAELTITSSQSSAGSPYTGGIFGGVKADVSSSVRVFSLPSHRLLFSTMRGAQEDELSKACKKTAKAVSKSLKQARGRK